MTQTNETRKALCIALMHADSEAEVIKLLTDGGYWNDQAAWRFLGDEEFNYSSVGNQQSKAEQAIIEKLVNAIDAKMICAARLHGDLPKSQSLPQSPETPTSIPTARLKYFKDAILDPERLSRSITVAATGYKPKQESGRPCFTIVDDGEGQTPARMPHTLLSLHKGNKDKIKFAQGKFNMGGTGVLEFCGMRHNLQLVISRRCPELLENPLANALDDHWSFTVIRREDPVEKGKSSRFTYLAPVAPAAGEDKPGVLNFQSETLPIFPEKNSAYVRESSWGTLLKLYEYDARRFGSQMMMSDGLMSRTRLLLPQPAIPIRFHECRAYQGGAGSFDTTMLGMVETLQRQIDDPKSDRVEWTDTLEFNVDGEKFTARVYLFKSKEAAENYRRDEGVLFTYNGQSHAMMTKDFFRRKRIKQDYLWHSLLVLVDCTAISPRAHEQLFMNSRDRLRDGELKAKLEDQLEDQLGHHEALRLLASERRKRELAEKPKASESMAKLIENLLDKHPALAALLGQGTRIKNPHKPESAGDGPGGFAGKQFPTKFQFKGQERGFQLIRDSNLNARTRIAFETDAVNDYFSRDEQAGTFELYRITVNGRVPASNYQRPRVHNGLAHLSLSLPDDATVDDDIEFEAVVNDPSRTEPFVNSFILNVRPEQSKPQSNDSERQNHGNEPDGADKGGGNKGDSQTRDGGIDIPDPTPVYERDWDKHEPFFDKFTAVRIKSQPNQPEGEERYDYYVNMDNVYLQSYLKMQPKHAEGIRLRFKIGMTLVGISILHQEHSRSKGGGGIDAPLDTYHVQDRVAQMTAALAPFLVPMIESVSQLDADEPSNSSVSESAGEAA